MKEKRSLKSLLLKLGMGLVVPFMLFTVFNVCLSAWPLYERVRPALVLATLLGLALLLVLLRGIQAYEHFLVAHEWAWTFGVCALFFLSQIILGGMLSFSPHSDIALCVRAAQAWAMEGAPSSEDLSLLAVTPNNFALLVLFKLLIQGIGASGLNLSLHGAVNLLGALLFIPGTLALLQSAKRLGGVRAKAAAAVLMMSCLPLLYCTAEMYTDMLTLPFVSMGFFLLLKTAQAETQQRVLFYALLSGVLLLVGLEIRVTVVILVIAALLCGTLCLKAKRLACFGVMLAVLLGGNAAFMAYRDEVMGEETLDTLSMPVVHWLVLGAPDEYGYTYGRFSAEDYLFATRITDPQKRETALWQRLKDRVYPYRKPQVFLSALSRKNLSTFGNGTFDFDELIGNENQAPAPVRALLIDQTSANRVYQHVTTGLLMAQMLIACASCARLLRQKQVCFGSALIMVSLTGIFLFLTLWETRARYFFNFMPMLILAGSLLVGQLDQKVDE